MYLALNGSGLRVLRFADLVHELLVKAEVGETRTRFWRSGARNLGDTNQRVSVSFTPGTNQARLDSESEPLKLGELCSCMTHPQVQFLSQLNDLRSVQAAELLVLVVEVFLKRRVVNL